MTIQILTFSAGRPVRPQRPEGRGLDIDEIHTGLDHKAARRNNLAGDTRVSEKESPVDRALRMFERGNAAEGLAAVRGVPLDPPALRQLVMAAAAQGLTPAVDRLSRRPGFTPAMEKSAADEREAALQKVSALPLTEKNRARRGRLEGGMKVNPNRRD